MKSSRLNLLKAFTLLLCLFVAADIKADTVDVDIAGFAFSPNDITVSAGTYVRWTNSDAVPHTSTSDSPYWDSGTLNNGMDFVFLFDTPGNYPYHCGIHPSMTAVVNVNEAASSVPFMNGYAIAWLILSMMIGGYLIMRKRSVTVQSSI